MEGEEPPIYHSFGRMTYWHLVNGAPRGTVDERAAALLKIVRKDDANFQKWDVRRLQIRAMSLELAAAAAQGGEPLGSDLLHLLAWAMDVPETFLSDPSDVLSGRDGKGQAVNPAVRDGAELLDWLHFQRYGEYMSKNALAKSAGVSPPSIREWVKGWRTGGEAEPLTGRAPEGMRTAVGDYVRGNLAKLPPRFQGAYNRLQEARLVVAARFARKK